MDELRKCGRCGELKPLDDFAWRRRERGQRHNYCRPCHKAYRREHYLANRDRYIRLAGERSRAVREERTRFLLDYFVENPCTDCGETDPVVLEFDHLEDKLFNVASSLVDRSWQAILEEIEKCDVVCANCHRRRTARRAGSLRFLFTAETTEVAEEPDGSSNL